MVSILCVLRVSGWCLDGVWIVSARCLESVCAPITSLYGFIWCLECIRSMWTVSIPGVLRVSG